MRNHALFCDDARTNGSKARKREFFLFLNYLEGSDNEWFVNACISLPIAKCGGGAALAYICVPIACASYTPLTHFDAGDMN